MNGLMHAGGLSGHAAMQSPAKVGCVGRAEYLMVRIALSGIVLVFGLISRSRADVTEIVGDEFDDFALVLAVADDEAVKVFRKDVEAFASTILRKEEAEIEDLLGKATAKPAKTYTMPIAQPRIFGIPGFGNTVARFYTVADSGGVEVYYSESARRAVAIIVYLKVAKDFPSLTGKNLRERLAWDKQRFTALVKAVNARSRPVPKAKAG